MERGFMRAPVRAEWDGVLQSDAQAAGAAVARGMARTRIGTSLYHLEGSGGAKLKLFWMEDELATVLFTIEGKVAKVQTINTHNQYQRQGLAKLLAACLFGFCEAKGAASVGLGTQDTSDGFWPRFGLSKANSKGIVELWVMLGPVVDVPFRPAAKATDGIDRSQKPLWVSTGNSQRPSGGRAANLPTAR